jgi:hypothetical protein
MAISADFKRSVNKDKLALLISNVEGLEPIAEEDMEELSE